MALVAMVTMVASMHTRMLTGKADMAPTKAGRLAKAKSPLSPMFVDVATRNSRPFKLSKSTTL